MVTFKEWIPAWPKASLKRRIVVAILSYSFECKNPARHPFVWPVGMNSPRCEDLKTVALQFEETFLFGANPFRIPGNIYLGNPFVPFQAVRAGVRNQRVQQISTFLHSFRRFPSFSRQEE
jgi:hypothetical protein